MFGNVDFLAPATPAEVTLINALIRDTLKDAGESASM